MTRLGVWSLLALAVMVSFIDARASKFDFTLKLITYYLFSTKRNPFQIGRDRVVVAGIFQLSNSPDSERKKEQLKVLYNKVFDFLRERTDWVGDKRNKSSYKINIFHSV